ncbi:MULTISPECIES: GxxExxY protein [unclassified Pedobacter]|jgi:GxxExxY protein|uniref:GxxExxY protein n=1 Tax=unclassified Pedobacter TaxID=2628915 RepID=UPI001557DF36|nr:MULTISPECIES: GxxExxY protein [unclassified Pedobacter]MCX2582675.1 GxxExxY protein [Pedobacter sp. MR22-3]
MTKTSLRAITYNVIGAAIEIHKALGPGLLESVYHECMKHELMLRNINFITEVSMPVRYKEIEVAAYLRSDLLIEGCLVVEVKASKTIEPIFEAQVLTYMKLLEAPQGLIINFNCVNIFNDGQKTFVNDFYRNLDDE